MTVPWRVHVESGCADGSTEGLQSRQHDRVAACDGRWSGHVDNASSLCADDWEVCGWDTLDLLRTLSRDDLMTLSGCYAINAAQHDGQCRPCHDQVITLQVHYLPSLPVKKVLKGTNNSSQWYSYYRATGRHLPYGIKQTDACRLLPATSERAPP